MRIENPLRQGQEFPQNFQTYELEGLSPRNLIAQTEKVCQENKFNFRMWDEGTGVTMECQPSPRGSVLIAKNTLSEVPVLADKYLDIYEIMEILEKYPEARRRESPWEIPFLEIQRVAREGLGGDFSRTCVLMEPKTGLFGDPRVLLLYLDGRYRYAHVNGHVAGHGSGFSPDYLFFFGVPAK